jgi:hypothetical protein
VTVAFRAGGATRAGPRLDRAPCYSAAVTTRERGLGAHLDAENAHDLDAIVASFAEDAVLVLNGEAFRGRRLIRVVHERFGFGGTGAFSDLRVEENARYATPEAIVLEERLSGRHTGAWEDLPPTGRSFAVPVCTVYVFDAAGLLTAERVYFDRSLLLTKLGA